MNNLDYIIKILWKIKKEEDIKDFLIDILTPQELENIYERLQVIKDLKKWASQREIAEKNKVSTTTVNRWARILRYGTGILNKINL